MMTVQAQRLLELIYNESLNSPRGQADGHTVATRYGEGFHDAFRVLIQEGYIESRGEVGTITLTGSGELAARGR